MILFVIGILLAGLSTAFIIGAPNTNEWKYNRFWAIIPMLIGAICISSSTAQYVGDHQTGLLTVKIGSSLPPGQIIARHGEQGPQARILGPGWNMWLWPWVYETQLVPLVEIPSGQVGLVSACDGKPLPPDTVFGPEWKSVTDMMDAEKFLEGDGMKGPQLTVLPPGKYRVNTLLFTITMAAALEVKVGEVAVIKANSGKATGPNDKFEMVNGSPLVDKGYQGIWKEPLGPGMYYLNQSAFKATMVSTTNRMYDYSETEDKKFSDPIFVRSKDGFTFPVDVRCPIVIEAKDTPYLVALLGDPDAMVKDGEDAGRIQNLEAKVVLPAIRTVFRNTAEREKALEFVAKRSEVEKQASLGARVPILDRDGNPVLEGGKATYATSPGFVERMHEYHLQSGGVLIGQIDLSHNDATKQLIETQTNQEVALNQQTMYTEQQKAAQKQIDLNKTKAEAEQQGELMKSKIAIDVAKNKAAARTEEAKGDAEYTKVTFEAKKTAYEGLSSSTGKDGVVLLEALSAVEKGNLQICPQVMVNGSGSGGMTDVLAGTMLSGLLGKSGKFDPLNAAAKAQNQPVKTE